METVGPDTPLVAGSGPSFVCCYRIIDKTGKDIQPFFAILRRNVPGEC